VLTPFQTDAVVDFGVKQLFGPGET
jgi:hypothetical protein